MQIHKAYIAGKFRQNEKTVEVRNPFNNELVGIACIGSASDPGDAIKGAEAVFPSLKTLPTFKRYNILMHIHRRLESDKHCLAEILAQEAAKPIKLAIGEYRTRIRNL